MPKIEWTDDLSVRIWAIDNEHKKLIMLINKLSDSMSQGQGQSVLAGILSELANYTKTHFKNEEALMEKHGYPKQDDHKKQHTELVNKLNELQSDYNSGKISLSLSIFNFLTSWIQNHIKKEDKRYSEFFIEKGVV
ncbi:MAG: bacteriohemerythrin [Candidatus Cloacimonetes bacterium]|nr:bacteriohemerythrin [Candidatus Cloacimonadota bacterium]